MAVTKVKLEAVDGVTATVAELNQLDDTNVIKVSDNDTTGGKLSTKLVQETEITVVVENSGGNETLKVNAPNMVAYAIALGG